MSDRQRDTSPLNNCLRRSYFGSHSNAFIQRGGIEPRRPMSQLGFLRGLGRRERYPTSFQKPALYDVRQPVPSWRTGSWPEVEYFGRLTKERSAHVEDGFDGAYGTTEARLLSGSEGGRRSTSSGTVIDLSLMSRHAGVRHVRQETRAKTRGAEARSARENRHRSGTVLAR